MANVTKPHNDSRYAAFITNHPCYCYMIPNPGASYN